MDKRDYIQESIDKKEESATLYILKQWGYQPKKETKINNVIDLKGLEKRLKLNREPNTCDLFMPVIISNSFERYKRDELKLQDLRLKEIPKYAEIHEISVEDAYHNINIIRNIQCLENIYMK